MIRVVHAGIVGTGLGRRPQLERPRGALAEIHIPEVVPIVLGLAAAFEIGIALIPAIRQFNKIRGSKGAWRTIRESKDSALIIVIFEDIAATIGVFIAAGGLLLSYYTENSVWDGIALTSPPLWAHLRRLSAFTSTPDAA